MKQILFVCTGNTCRSPMAEVLFNRLAALEQPGYGFRAVSAGLSANGGDHASTNAAKVIKSYSGADLSCHRARELSCDDVDSAYLVLTMSKNHKQYILSMCPGAYQKVFTLKEYVYGASEDISDPYGSSETVYRHCADEIAQAVEMLAEKVKFL